MIEFGYGYRIPCDICGHITTFHKDDLKIGQILCCEKCGVELPVEVTIEK